MRVPLHSGIMKKRHPNSPPFPSRPTVQERYACSMAVLHSVLPSKGRCTFHQSSPWPQGEGTVKSSQAAGSSRATIWYFILMSVALCRYWVLHSAAWVRSDTGGEWNQVDGGRTELNPFLSSRTTALLHYTAVTEAYKRALLELLLHHGSLVLLQRKQAPLCQGTLLFNTVITQWEPVSLHPALSLWLYISTQMPSLT